MIGYIVAILVQSTLSYTSTIEKATHLHSFPIISDSILVVLFVFIIGLFSVIGLSIEVNEISNIVGVIALAVFAFLRLMNSAVFICISIAVILIVVTYAVGRAASSYLVSEDSRSDLVYDTFVYDTIESVSMSIIIVWFSFIIGLLVGHCIGEYIAVQELLSKGWKIVWYPVV